MLSMSLVESASRGSRWAVVLAGGEGSRLGDLLAVPKQYWSPDGRQSLIALALGRAQRIAARSRILAVVAAHHQRWWSRELRNLSAGNVLVQPQNRGTAVGILLPLLSIYLRDPGATVVVLPSDHWVEDERTLHGALEQTLLGLDTYPQKIVLLGMVPETCDPDYGWIVKTEPLAQSLYRVERFVEKPSADLAAELRSRGGLLNSFLVAGRVKTLLRLYAVSLPEVVRPFLQNFLRTGDVWQVDRIGKVYGSLSTWDFSQHLLEPSVEHLAVLPVPPCGWRDLGTPERLAATLPHWSLGREAA
jgi:mannose-1-phosphate guanylyltransferase